MPLFLQQGHFLLAKWRGSMRKLMLIMLWCSLFLFIFSKYLFRLKNNSLSLINRIFDFDCYFGVMKRPKYLFNFPFHPTQEENYSPRHGRYKSFRKNKATNFRGKDISENLSIKMTQNLISWSCQHLSIRFEKFSKSVGLFLSAID